MPIRINKKTISETNGQANAGGNNAAAHQNAAGMIIKGVTRAAEPAAQGSAENPVGVAAGGGANNAAKTPAAVPAAGTNGSAAETLNTLTEEELSLNARIEDQRFLNEGKRSELETLVNEQTQLEHELRIERIRRDELQKEYDAIRALPDLPDDGVLRAADEYMKRLRELVSRADTGAGDAEAEGAQAEGMSGAEFTDPVEFAPLAADYAALSEKLVELHAKLVALLGNATVAGDERTKKLSRNEN